MYICRMFYIRLVLLLFIPVMLKAQPAGTLSGRVTCGGEPVPYAVAGLKGTSFGVTADVNGVFEFSALPSGRYELVVQATGYRIFSRTVLMDGERQTVQVALVQDESALNEVVVTGSLRAVERTESVIPVETYSPQFWKRAAAPVLFESLQLMNGIQPQVNCNVCNTGDIHINGMEGPYTMVLIDGMPIVSSLSTVYGLSGIPNSLIRQLEVVKGPASTLYGSEAMAGVINIITRSPLTAPRFAADVQLSSIGEVNADVSAAYSGRRWRGMTGVNVFDYSLPRDINNDGFTDMTLQERLSVFQKFTRNRKDTLPSQLAFRLYGERRWGGETNWSDEWAGTDSIYGESITTQRAEAYFQEGYRNAWGTWMLEGSYNFHRQDSWYGQVSYDAVQHTGFMQWRWMKSSKHHHWMAGLPVRYVYYDDNTPGTAGADTITFRNAPMQVLMPGLFIQDEIHLSDRWQLLPGFRIDLHEEHGWISSPRMAARYKYHAHGMIRVSAGNGFRTVNLFTEDHAALSGARVVDIQETMKPERSWNGNLNLNHQFFTKGGIFAVDVNLFYTRFTNRITGDFITDPQRIIYRNLNGYAISRGAGVNVDYQQGNWRGNAGCTFLDVFREEDGVRWPQLHAPAFSGVGGLSYSSVNRHWVFDLTGRVTGPMYLPVVPDDFRPEKSPWFALLNMQVTYKTNAWELYSGVKNLLNFIPEDPILRPFDPFDKYIDVNNPYNYTFDPSYNYAPVQGAKFFIGWRYTIG